MHDVQADKILKLKKRTGNTAEFIFRPNSTEPVMHPSQVSSFQSNSMEQKTSLRWGVCYIKKKKKPQEQITRRTEEMGRNLHV